MTSVPLVTITGYERRLALVRAEIREGSDLSEQAVLALAVRVLAALDHIPENVR
ncbi:DUF6307 family protein [Pseudonocardia sp. NPDC049154]|uniref:DUF6307 family protein n=1 Tax=Pseudonocardia sp. NPDC049154 TaxID=3155501 RepID=UPI0033FDEC5A